MALVVFLKGVNVGGHRSFRPSAVARDLAKYGVVNVGAAGTFIVTRPVSQAKLRDGIRRCLPFEVETMICSAKDVLNLTAGEPFESKSSGQEITRFVSILAKRPRTLPTLPICLPSEEDWLVKIIAIRGRFAFGVYRRTMRTIGFLSQLEKHLGGPATTRNWNTITTIIETLRTRPCADANRFD